MPRKQLHAGTMTVWQVRGNWTTLQAFCDQPEFKYKADFTPDKHTPPHPLLEVATRKPAPGMLQLHLASYTLQQHMLLQLTDPRYSLLGRTMEHTANFQAGLFKVSSTLQRSCHGKAGRTSSYGNWGRVQVANAPVSSVRPNCKPEALCPFQ